MTVKCLSCFQVGQEHGHGERNEKVPAAHQPLGLASVSPSFGTGIVLVYGQE